MSAFRARGIWLPGVAALLVSLTAYVPVIASGHITRDSGVFLYTGMVVSRGGMPYVDSWDHKGPLLAVIEAIAWRVGGGFVGAPLIEAIVLCAALAIAGAIWSRWIHAWSAVVVLLVGVTYLAVFEGGNFTETWLFPFQLVAYSLVGDVMLRSGRETSSRVAGGLGSIIGLALAVGLFTRPNNVAGLLLLVLISAAFLRRRIVFLGTTVVTVGVIAAALILWLWSGDALRAGVEQYVRYNIFYAGGAPPGERVGAFAELSQVLVSGAIVSATFIVIGARLAVRSATVSPLPVRVQPAMVFLTIGGLDAVSQMTSGRPYPHYLVVAIAGFAVAVAAAAAPVLPMVRRWWTTGTGVRHRGLRVVAVLGLSGLVLSSSTATAAQGLATTTGAGVRVAGSYQALIVDRVVAETSPDDRVLVHGAETWILAAAQRLSPTPITYSLPVEQGFGGLPEQYLAEITSFPPALIVESPTACGISLACPPDEAHFDGLAPWVAAHYELDGDIVGFRFWKRIQDGGK